MKVSDYRLCQLLEPLHVLYLSVFLDLFSVGLVVPLLPHIAKEIGVSPSVYGGGYVVNSFSIMLIEQLSSLE